MKAFITSLLLGLLINPLFAQKIINKNISWSPEQTTNLNLKFADSIRIRYWDKPEMSVRISVTINGGKLNDGLVVTSNTTNDAITFKTDFDQELLKQGKAEDCPGNSKSVWSTDGNGKHYVCSEINYVVYLPKQAKLKLETINGNIDIQGATSSVYAKTISGFVDMTWPKTKGANLAMKTITGEVYSDLDISFKNKSEKNPIVGYLLKGAVNGGGPDVQLESISNNVYLRKRD
ncbi:hypothetical protein [Dyadobacter psychrotolerans]|uniref:Adhesin domain-containing protein n=1 Tax=Dyadobacter psychrotolerans TaxID=2541721 RepID=A0A4R5DI15_9BACT|nr:hypothetical protein [Dyadobacter psychrotolerans]TDE12927.1 hypothetical protein E0F88_21565 [Dyadobacter psychrotolerans]